MTSNDNQSNRRLATDDLDKLLGSERDVEGMLLRGHLLLERELLRLLATRLTVDVDDLPNRITFDLLARLVFAGHAYDTVRANVLAINGTRNRLAHSIDYDGDAAHRDLAAVIGEAKSRAPQVFEGRTDPAGEVRAAIVANIGLIMDMHIAVLKSRRELFEELSTLRNDLKAIKEELQRSSRE